MNWIIDRLKEKSTWAGIIGLVTATGLVAINPEQKEAILTAITAITSAVLVFIKEQPKA